MAPKDASPKYLPPKRGSRAKILPMVMPKRMTKAKRSLLFADTSEDGFYGDVFNDSPTPFSLLLPYSLLLLIETKKADFRRVVNKASEELRKTLEGRIFVLHASTYLLAMMGFLLNERYGDT